MTPHPNRVRWFIAMLLAFALTPALFADEKEELKARFEQRDARLTALKTQGKVGETWHGLVDVVKQEGFDAAAKQLMDEENADRRKLYAIIARDMKKTEAAVAAHNALRNFAAAKPGEYLKADSGPWVRRGDAAALKRDGKIGETWEGYVEAVNPQNRDPRITALVLVENSARKYVYERESRERKATAAQIAQAAGQQNINKARSGEYIKNQGGNWERKK